MPCSDGGYDRSFEEIRGLKKRNNRLARLLCRLCRVVEAIEKDRTSLLSLADKNLADRKILPTSVRKWWKTHKVIDKRRRATEKRERVLAIKRLTHEAKELQTRIDKLTNKDPLTRCEECSHRRSEHTCENYKCKHTPKDRCHHIDCKCKKFVGE